MSTETIIREGWDDIGDGGSNGIEGDNGLNVREAWM